MKKFILILIGVVGLNFTSYCQDLSFNDIQKITNSLMDNNENYLRILNERGYKYFKFDSDKNWYEKEYRFNNGYRIERITISFNFNEFSFIEFTNSNDEFLIKFKNELKLYGYYKDYQTKTDLGLDEIYLSKKLDDISGFIITYLEGENFPYQFYFFKDINPFKKEYWLKE